MVTQRPSSVSSPVGVTASTPGFRQAANRELSSTYRPNYPVKSQPTSKSPVTGTLDTSLPRIIDPLLDRDKYSGVIDRARTVMPSPQDKAPSAEPAPLPPALQTPYAAPMPHHGMMTPTFLPVRQEDVFPRLFSNVAQGMVGAVGHHLLDYARVVDMFGPYR